jgi:hypothetical protein
MKVLMISLLALSTVVLAGGCASSNVNPAAARHDTGYVDFYTAGTNELYWDVTDIALNKKVFSEFSPLRSPILRLAFKPGQYQFQITFLNRVIAAAGTAEVEVRDGMVTPVIVTLLPMNSVVVQTKRSYHYSQFGRRTKTGESQTVDYKIIAEPHSPLPHRPKEQMPYFHLSGQ